MDVEEGELISEKVPRHREKDRRTEKDTKKHRDHKSDGKVERHSSKDKHKEKEKDDSARNRDEFEEGELPEDVKERKNGRDKDHAKDSGNKRSRDDAIAQKKDKERTERNRKDEKERDVSLVKEKRKSEGKHLDKERAKDKSQEDRVKEKDEGVKEIEVEKRKDRDSARNWETEQGKEDSGKKKEAGNDKEKEKVKTKDRLADNGRPREREKEKDREKEKEKRKDRERGKDGETDKVKSSQKREKEKPSGKERKADVIGDAEHRKLERKDQGQEAERTKDRDRSKSAKEGKETEKPKEQKESVQELSRHVHSEKSRDSGTDREREKTLAVRDEKPSDELQRVKRAVPADEESKPLPVPAEELEARVARFREERLKSSSKSSRGKGPSAAKGETSEEENETDIAAWVAKSRQLQEKKKKEEEREKAARMARLLAEQDEKPEEDEDGFMRDDPAYKAKDLAGLRVRHGLDKVMQGGAVVLTLKDSSILESGELNEAADELENVEIAEQVARDAAYKAAKKKPGTYEDKFHNDLEQDHKILPQYDEAIEQEGVLLDEDGGLDQATKLRLDEVRRRLHGAAGFKESLGSGTGSPKIASDFFTASEMLQFKKPKKKKNLRKKRKGAEDEDGLDLEAMEAEARAAGLGGADRGSREAALSRREAAMKEEREQRERANRAAYETAYSKAVEASKVLLEDLPPSQGLAPGNSGASPMEQDFVAGDKVAVKIDEREDDMNDVRGREPLDQGKMRSVGEEEEEIAAERDDDEELQKSLERARQAALKRQLDVKLAGATGVASKVAQLAQLRRVKAENSTASSESATIAHLESSADVTPEGALVFTDTGEFCRSLQLDEAITRRTANRDVFGEEEDLEKSKEVKREEAEEEMKEKASALAAKRQTTLTETPGGWTRVQDETMEDASEDPATAKEDDEEEEEVEEPIREVQLGKGLAGALSLLQERGTLKQEVEWGGRNMDKKKSKLVGVTDNMAPPGQKEIRIDRVDEFGRIMTPKEAFRKLSHAFHGKGPGKMKQEKRIKQYTEELKLKQMHAGDTPLAAMDKIRTAQATSNAPYLVISGQIRPGQTSDPRSGFATVEKTGSLTPMLGDAGPGSLTPMLGDRKVEHFLGIKRKVEGAAMGPPASKKPKSER